MSGLLDRSVFQLRRLASKTDEALLSELRRVAALVPGRPLTVGVFTTYGKVSRGLYNDRFGGWAEALAAAGLSAQSTQKPVKKGPHPARSMSDDDILKNLRDLAKQLGVRELTTADLRKHLSFGGGVLRSRWGTSKAALEAAGLSTSVHGKRYNYEECFRNLLVVWTYYGRPPKYLEMRQTPSQVGGKAYVARFGTWNSALAAFVERVNVEPVEEGSTLTSDTTTKAKGKLTPQLAKSTEDVREIALGLRFRVLHRDRFKCVLCGNHPATDSTCKLQVDHIQPWSKGGKTREDNLRTLCETCNVGRGNRFQD